MQLMVDIDIKKLPAPIKYGDKLLLIGSCFTEHIGNSLQDLKFDVLQNPNGILFDPESVWQNLVSYIQNRQYTADDLFQLNEIWNSWHHHTRFSNTDIDECLRLINEAQNRAHHFLTNANWIIITLGSAFSYRLTGEALLAAELLGNGVANCHRAPAQWFKKKLLETNEIIAGLENSFQQLSKFNPAINVIFTVSPVRHIRDGVIENNRSKARLIEAVHHLVNKSDKVFYFPAYELVVDVLRDYRFYDIDLVHPNYSATQFVLEKFEEACIAASSRQLMKEIEKIVIARKHKAFQPKTKAHEDFLKTQLEKTRVLQKQYPFLDFEDELDYFSGRHIL
jgi:hypothetical protein